MIAGAVYAAIGAFFGAGAGVLVTLSYAARKLWRLADEDPELGKVEIRVFFTGEAPEQ